ncbi:hypothetical protein C266_25845 [Pandoraea sp. SD6-2]|nr:hypothetical protein C266_25845 [Pandoraea sp. SD6-2]
MHDAFGLAHFDGLRAFVKASVDDAAQRLERRDAGCPSAKPPQKPQCTERRMAAHLHLVPGDEEAKTIRAARITRFAHECAFVTVARGDRHHLVRRKRIRIRYGQSLPTAWSAQG